MSSSTAQFWKLLTDSELVTSDEAARLADEFTRISNGDEATPHRAAQWLVAAKRISEYQAKIVLAGHAGPFVYGDYRIYDRIESGRLAGMFRALHLPTRHRVCLFFLSGQAVQDQATVARLAYQASQANRASIGHPHLMRCYHLADEGTFKFIALEDMQGRRVERRLATAGAMQPTEACRIARQAALGLARIHAMGQVHGEVRPGNLWIEPSGNTKLLMFPLARDPLAPPPRYDQPGEAGRLPPEIDYLAPELAAGAAPDARSDIYALGCSLYHMLANQAPFPAGDLRQRLARHATEKPAALESLNPAVTPALAKLVGYMMTKDPELRYQQANSIVEALLPHLAPQDAQTRPQPASKAAMAYDGWLRMMKEPPAPPAETQATPSPPTPAASEPAPTPQPMAPQVAPAPPMAQAFAMPQPPLQATPLQAMPMQATPMRAVPVQAMPMAGGYPQAAYAQPMYAQPMQQPAPAAPVAGGDTPAVMRSVSARSRRASRQSRRTLLMVLLAVLLLGGTAAGVWMSTREPGDTTAQKDNGTPPPDESGTPSSDAGDAPQNTGDTPAVSTLPPVADEPRDVIAAIDQPVWASPTQGKPVSLRFLAPGAQMIVAIRPFDLITQPEAARLLDPRVTGVLDDWLRTQVPKLVGTPLENIEQLLVGVLDRGTQLPEIALVARTREPVAAESAQTIWGNVSPVELEGHTYYKGDQHAFWMPAAGKDKIVVVAPPAEMGEIIAGGGDVLLLLPPMESLLRTTDDQRQLTVLASPRFLAAGGQTMFTGVGSRLSDALTWLLTASDGVSQPEAALASLQLSDSSSFLELRLYDSTASPQVSTAAATVRDRVKQLPRKLDVYIRGLASTPYSFGVLSSSYDMLRAVVDNMRFGTADKQVVARLYLPAKAAHNLALVGHLAILENPGLMGSGVAANPSAPAQPQTVAEKLKKKITLAFPRNTLEVSMQLLSDELSVPVTILGSDLQLEGITKNQSFGLDERDQPAEQILQKIMKQANPDGKLVYVIKPGASGGDELFITTRAAVAKRGDKLPPELELPK